MWKSIYYSLFNPKIDKSAIIGLLKNNLDFNELCELVDKSDIPLSYKQKYIYGYALPKNYNDLGKLDYYAKADSFEKELNWLLLAIREYKSEIKLFLKLKKEYENHFLKGDYNLAEQTLTDIESNVCYSLWTLESRMFLLEKYVSPQDHKNFLSEFTKNSKGFFTKIFAHYISNKAEENFSIPKYESDINNILHNGKISSIRDHVEYYYFKLNFYYYKNYSEYTGLLSLESHHSVIDRYLTIVKIFELISTKEDIKNEVKIAVSNKITYVLKKTQDDSLIKIQILLNPDTIVDYSYENFDYRGFDYYTEGQYEKAINVLGKNLLLNPNNYDYYITYVKSHLMLNKTVRIIGSENSIQSKIINSIYKIYNKDNSQEDTVTFLKQLTNQISNFEIAKGVHKFLNEEILGEKEWLKFDSLVNNYNNSAFKNVFSDQYKSLIFLKVLQTRLHRYMTAKLEYNKELTGEYNYYDLNIPDYQISINYAEHYQQINEYTKSINIWRELILKYKSFILIYETSVKNLFDDYVKGEYYNEAISHYVDNYFYNSLVVNKIDCNVILDTIRKSRFRIVSPSIDLPIFYTLCGSDENELHTAFEKFNKSISVELPSQIIKYGIDLDKKKLIFYLSITCNTELFKHSIYIDGTKERYSERINILQQLIEIDKENISKYKKELESLTEKLILLEGLQQLDESKIYVNEQGLFLTELKDYEGLYNRYKTVSKVIKESDFVWLDIKSGKIKSINAIKQGVSEADKYSSHPLRDVFEESFSVIKDKFLHSKFGIAAYLSTRIRHGVLLGELRPIFEKYHLISNKDVNNGKYQPISYWLDKGKYLTQDDFIHLQNSLGSLSERIDTEIQSLIKNNLQINVTNSVEQDSWFNYSFTEEELTLYALSLKDTTDYKDYLNRVLDILWYRTDENLIRIKDHFKNEVKSSFNKIINEFDNDLRLYIDSRYMPEIYTNIATCLTDVQNSIDRVARWFNRSGIKTSDFTIERIINVVLENINHSYPSKSLNVSKKINTNHIIKGEFYSHFADLFRIFFENILKHSLSSEKVIPTYIEIENIDDYIIIDITNCFPNTSSLEISSGFESSLNFKKVITEDKSGFHKAKKIIKSDLKNDYNELKWKLDNEENFNVSLTINIKNLIL